MLLSAVSVLVVVQSSSEIPEGLMNNPVHHKGLFLTTLRLGEHSTVSRASNAFFPLTNGFIIHNVLRNRVASVA